MKTRNLLLALSGSSLLLTAPLFAQQNGKTTPPAATTPKTATAAPATPAPVANGPAGVAAEVNNEKILLADLNMRLDSIKEDNPELAANTPEAKAKLSEIRGQVLEDMIRARLMVQEARRRKITIPQADIDEAVNSQVTYLKTNLKLDDAGFQNWLKESKKTMDDMKQAITETLLINELKLQMVSDVVVSNDDIGKFYREHIIEYTKPEQVEARQILLALNPASPKEEKERVKKRAAALIAQLNGGADFATLAKNNSDDPISRGRGGLDLFKKSTTPTPAETAVFSAPIGKVIGPLETNAGVHIFKVEKKIPAEVAPLTAVLKDPETKADVLRLKSQQRLSESVGKLKTAATIKKYV